MSDNEIAKSQKELEEIARSPRPECPKVPTNYFGKGETYVLPQNKQQWFSDQFDRYSRTHPDDPEGVKAIAKWRVDLLEWKTARASLVARAVHQPGIDRVIELQRLQEIKDTAKERREESRHRRSILEGRRKRREKLSFVPMKTIMLLIRQAAREGISMDELVQSMIRHRTRTYNERLQTLPKL